MKQELVKFAALKKLKKVLVYENLLETCKERSISSGYIINIVTITPQCIIFIDKKKIQFL